METRPIPLQGVVHQQAMFPTVQIAMIMTIPYIREQQRSAMVKTMIAMDRLMKVVPFRRVRIVKRAAHIRRDSMVIRKERYVIIIPQQ
jgi:hypothetical protein